MSGTIEEFDDDTDFALPTPPAAGDAPPGGMSMSNLQDMMAQMQAGGSGQAMGMPPGMTGDQMGPQDVELSAEEKKWLVLYPIYFDAKQRYEKGCRRVAYEKACLWPKSEAIEKAVQKLNLLHIHEPRKAHPRTWENPGRIRVRLSKDDGTPFNQKIPSKKALLLSVAEIIQPSCGGVPPPLGSPKKQLDTKTVQKIEQGGKVHPQHKNAHAKAKGKPRHRTPSRVHAHERVKNVTFPSDLRYPDYSPNAEAGLLNTDFSSMMGGLQGMGPLGAMMGQMGLGGEEEEEDEKEEETGAKKTKDPLQQLSRRQRKRVIRVGR